MALQELFPVLPSPQQRSSITLSHLETTVDNSYPLRTSSTEIEPNGEISDGQHSAAEKNTSEHTGDLRSQNQNPEPEWAHGFQLFTILTAVTFVVFLMLLDGTIVVAAVPRITDEFNSLDDIGWYGAAYQLGRYMNSSFERTWYHE